MAPFARQCGVSTPAVGDEAREAQTGARPDDDADYVEARMVSLLENLPQVQSQPLPDVPQGDVRPFEVLGIPLSPGFHVLEVILQTVLIIPTLYTLFVPHNEVIKKVDEFLSAKKE